jgi:hypothetical protein
LGFQFDARACSDNEIAASNVGSEDYATEAEIATRQCGCEREDPNVCECFAWLRAARVAPVSTHEEALADMMRKAMRACGAKAVPRHIGAWTALLFLAPRGNELAQETLAQVLRTRPDHDATGFQDRCYVALLYAAFDAHPDYGAGSAPKAILRWWLAGVAAAESARLVDWFCANHPMQARQIEKKACPRGLGSIQPIAP